MPDDAPGTHPAMSTRPGVLLSIRSLRNLQVDRRGEPLAPVEEPHQRGACRDEDDQDCENHLLANVRLMDHDGK